MPALPLLRTWQFDVNQVLVSSDSEETDRALLIWSIKESLINFTSSPWTVAGSSDGTTGGMDATDRWVSPANIIFNANGSAHSWIVLAQPGLGGMQVMISMRWPTFDIGHIRVSQSALYTGGTQLADPTAVGDQWLNPSQEWYGGLNVTSSDSVLHVMQSDDGKSTRIIVFNTDDNQVGLFAIFDEVLDPTPGWSPAILSGWDADYGSDELDYGGRYDSSVNMYGEHAGTQMLFLMTALGFNANPIGKIVTSRDTNEEWAISGIGLVSFTTGKTGRHGRLADLYFGAENAPTRIIYEEVESATVTLAQIRDMVFPWPVGEPVKE